MKRNHLHSPDELDELFGDSKERKEVYDLMAKRRRRDDDIATAGRIMLLLAFAGMLAGAITLAVLSFLPLNG